MRMQLGNVHSETISMNIGEDDLWEVKTGVATLAICIARALEKSDPDFGDRFQKNLERAFDHFRNNYGHYTRRDGTPRDTETVLELLSWTREMLIGWSFSSGQGEPFLKNDE